MYSYPKTVLHWSMRFSTKNSIAEDIISILQNNNL